MIFQHRQFYASVASLLGGYYIARLALPIVFGVPDPGTAMARGGVLWSDRIESAASLRPPGAGLVPSSRTTDAELDASKRDSSVLAVLKSPERWSRFAFKGVWDFEVNRSEFELFGLPTSGLGKLETALTELKRSLKEAEESSFEVLHRDNSNILILIPKGDGAKEREQLREAIRSYAGKDRDLEDFIYNSAVNSLGTNASQLAGFDKVIILSRQNGDEWLLQEGSLPPKYSADEARIDRSVDIIRPRMGGGPVKRFKEIPKEYSHLLQ